MTAADMANSMQTALTTIRPGTLRFWGQWFGRPYDNWHRITGVESIGDVLCVHFDQGETLKVWHPSEIKIGNEIFRIMHASRIRWEWHAYGSPQTSENRHFQELVMVNGKITGTSNDARYAHGNEPSIGSPAVEIL